MQINLEGRVALVCGSSQGIGKACAIQLAASGARVILLARDAQKLAAICQALPRPYAQAHLFLVADFSEPALVSKAVAEITMPVHILINNTGGPAGGLITNAEPAAFEAAFRMHVINNQIITQALLPGMRAANYGRIVNIISTSVKQPIPNLGVSNTIRAAVANWAKTLAGEVAAAGITVNNVLPGYTETERLETLIRKNAEFRALTDEQIRHEYKLQIPARRFATAEEIAFAVTFLCSAQAGYITGINLPVDGGRLGCL
jgi:3-oxoacyl-[acyl-carrier protein] reductase